MAVGALDAGPSQGIPEALRAAGPWEARTLPEFLKMAKIDIKETSEGMQAIGPGLKQQQVMNGRSPSSKSPSPARRDAAPNNSNNSSADSLNNGPSNREGVSNESGYFEDEEEGSEVRENSIEIIFDKNASNNNSGNKASDKSGKNCVFCLSVEREFMSSS